jgi:glyoxylate utilization-related uncharacterized protein
LERIAAALNTRAGYFFEREGVEGLVIIKKGFGRKFVNKEKKITSDTLASGFLNIKMEPFIFTLGGGAELTKELFYPEGEKFGMVLKGRVQLIYDSKKIVMKEGDSIYCAYIKKPKKIINIAGTETKLLWIVFIPS